ncbi:XRE family transcriptional regulator [Sphingomonas azotifigens]|uniref:XRE family transcriptional regulator n=1 Tax=Sphingomonas azotifigens TaxID=330920 RepID=UPI001431F628|nr:S24 family peptidase [Sphingomonas azotifigens]
MEEPNLDSPAERLKWARKRAGFDDAAQFARAAKINPTTYRAYENGQNGFARQATIFARLSGVSVEWLLGGGSMPDTDPPEPPALGEFGTPEILTDRFNIELVRRVDIRYAMGDGAIVEDYPDAGFMPFDRDFLKVLTPANPAQVFLATGHGDSMEPTIRRDALVMIDTSQNRIAQQDMIWALSFAGAGMIKRVRRLPRDRFLILSDNPAVPPQEAEADDLYIVGRVVWAGMGL